MTDEWTGMRNHHVVAARVSDEHYQYLQQQKAAGIPIVEVIRQALNRHIAAQQNPDRPDALTVYWDNENLKMLQAASDD